MDNSYYATLEIHNLYLTTCTTMFRELKVFGYLYIWNSLLVCKAIIVHLNNSMSMHTARITWLNCIQSQKLVTRFRGLICDITGQS